MQTITEPCRGLIFRCGISRRFKTYHESHKYYNKTTDTMKTYDWNRTFLSNYQTLYYVKSYSCEGCPECKKIVKALTALEPKLESLDLRNISHGKYYAIYLNDKNELTIGEVIKLPEKRKLDYNKKRRD